MKQEGGTARGADEGLEPGWEGPSGRDVIPVYSEPIASGTLTALASLDPAMIVVEAFDAEGFRSPPGMSPVLYVRGIVICVRSEEVKTSLTGGTSLPALL